MITDERIDLLVRDALSSAAETSARRQPTLAEAADRVAGRVAPSTRVRGARLVPAHGMGGLNLVTLVLLLVALMTVALYIGSLLLMPPPRVPFGFGGPCDNRPIGGLAFEQPGNEIVLTHSAPGEVMMVYADGRWVYPVMGNPQTRPEELTFEAIEQRRLSARGLRLLEERIRETGLTPGRREMSSAGAIGDLTARIPEGVICASWGPRANFYTYRLDEELEARLARLSAGLQDPAAWLPPEAWVEPARRRIKPDHFLIQVTSRPFEPTPGEPLVTPNGFELREHDPRYELVEMPGGVAPLAFGAPLPEGFGPPGTTTRCAAVTLEEALVLARSLDKIDGGEYGLGTHESGNAIYGPGLAVTIDFATGPVYGADYGCAELAADREFLLQPQPSPSPLPVAGDAAGLDPCRLVPDVALALVAADSTDSSRSRLPIGVGAHACTAFDSSVPAFDDPGMPADQPPPGWRAIVTLYPRSLPRGAMSDLLESTFGIDLEPTALGEHPVWEVPCTETDDFALPCRDGYIGWASGHVLFFELSTAQQLREGYTEPVFDAAAYEPIITPEEAALFVRAVLDRVLEVKAAD